MRYWLGLGANVGHEPAAQTADARLQALRQAARQLAALGPLARSRVYESAPVGGPPQPPYLNAAVRLDCALAPLELLARTQAIEAAAGRDRARELRWGPRPLDIDLLLAGAQGELLVDEPALRLPHPRLAERGFALAPLVDLDATLVHPELGRPLATLVDAARAAGQVWARVDAAL